ncbi:MAG TPA: biosynthetic peptidoglycan transglycosylase, partial [Gammaproteobacteria bacterium]
MRGVARYCAVGAPLVAVWLAAVLTHLTQLDLRELPATLTFTTDAAGGIEIERAGDAAWRGMQVLDRRGEPLNATFTNGWNLYDAVPLHDIPPFLRTAFVIAEDKRFFEHHGPDWRARLSAAWTNVQSGRAVRGASTISEQVVRMLHPRPRSVWSRWLEGFEARELEQRFTKNEILAFYLNQVPYAANRRGVRQAASYYFDRDLATLSKKEMLALAVLVRAPTRFDL